MANQSAGIPKCAYPETSGWWLRFALLQRNPAPAGRRTKAATGAQAKKTGGPGEPPACFTIEPVV